MMKKRLFLVFARIMRTCLDMTETLLGIFVPKDRISEKHLPKYQQQEVWKREYQIWEANRKEFLAKALPRTCPSCNGSDSAFLWNSEDGYQYVQCRECDFVYVTPYFSYNLWREYFKRFEKDTEASCGKLHCENYFTLLGKLLLFYTDGCENSIRLMRVSQKYFADDP